MTTFNHVNNIGEKGPISLLEDNIKMFLDWSFLNIGGFINVKLNNPDISNNNFSQLKLTSVAGSAPNTMWESVRKDWVYENNINYSNNTPINISGIYLNNTFLSAPTGSGAYGYAINYPLGRISFNNPINANSNVKLEYSYRYVQVYKANDTSWWKEFQDQTYNAAYSKTNNITNISSDNRIQFPAIVVENTSRTYLKPYELGTSENIVYQDVLLYIFSDTGSYRNVLVDILLKQKDKILHLIDTNKVIKNKVNQLNYLGQKNPTGLNYDQLFGDPAYYVNKSHIKDAILTETDAISNGLFTGIVRWTLEIFP